MVEGPPCFLRLGGVAAVSDHKVRHKKKRRKKMREPRVESLSVAPL